MEPSPPTTTTRSGVSLFSVKPAARRDFWRVAAVFWEMSSFLGMRANLVMEGFCMIIYYFNRDWGILLGGGGVWWF